MTLTPPRSTLFPYTTLFRSDIKSQVGATIIHRALVDLFIKRGARVDESYQLNLGGDTDFQLITLIHSRSSDRKSTRLNSSHANISYAVFCLKKKNNQTREPR